MTPGVVGGRPASSAAKRATLRLSSPAWLTQPSITSEICAGSTLLRADHFLDHLGGEVVGAHRGELAGVAADRGAQAVVEVGVEHGFLRSYSGVSKDTPSCARRLSQGLGR